MARTRISTVLQLRKVCSTIERPLSRSSTAKIASRRCRDLGAEPRLALRRRHTDALNLKSQISGPSTSVGDDLSPGATIRKLGTRKSDGTTSHVERVGHSPVRLRVGGEVDQYSHRNLPHPSAK